jgi:hypothetical protein
MATDDKVVAEYRARAERRRRIMLWSLLPLSVLAAGAGLLLARHEDHSHKRVPWYVLVALLVVVLLIAALELGIMAWIHRRRRGTWLPELSGLGGAPRAVRKRVNRATRHGRLPDDATERALAVDWAEKVQRLRWVIWLMGAAVLLDIPGLFLQRREVGRIAVIVQLVCFLIAIALYGYYLRRAAKIRRAARG